MTTFFTSLTQPADTVSQSPPAAPFDAGTAYLLGQCCNLANAQFDAGAGWSPDWSSLTVAGYTVALASATTPSTNPQPLTMAEAYGPLPTVGAVGDYTQLPAGFAVQLTLTPTGGGSSQTLVVIALRGTRTWQEWFNDVEALPVMFPGGQNGLGTVHAGFFADYTMGTSGVTSTTPLSTTAGQRAPGSLAAQIQGYVSQLDGSLPIYVTGHSLGGALAALCALDVAFNFPDSFSSSSLAMYSLASPRVAVGLDGNVLLDPAYGDQEAFLQSYQKYVPNTYAIVHAADIVPILPPLATPIGSLALACAQVTDQWGGVGAVATAQLDSAGGVASINLGTGTGAGTGYLSQYPPDVVISGGGGSGAQATASVNSIFGTIESISVTAAGSGYTTPPAVQIVSTGPSLLGNVISFCAQTGDIVNNHLLTATYLPYLALLASGLDGSNT